MVGSDQRVVGLHHDVEVMAFLYLAQLGALLVEDIEGDGGRHIDHDLGRALADAFFFDGAQDMQRRRFHGADDACAGAVRAAFEIRLQQRRTQALA